jgi:hypothetical protein
MDERKINHSVDLAQQVVRRDQAVQCNNLKRRLRRGWFLQHHNNESKTPGLRQGFVSSLSRPEGGFLFVQRINLDKSPLEASGATRSFT